MSIKLGTTDPITNFDIKKTLGDLEFIEVQPQYDFEEYTDEETGEIRQRPTDVIREYNILCYSSVAKGNIVITVPVDAKGIEIDEDKAYREKIVFEGLSARLWGRRERRRTRDGERTVLVTGTKLRATDFKLAATNDNKLETKPDNQPKKG
ncbi:DUF961 family protein [Streptococcus hyointestinalis]|uniref:DUF961 family protein n=1 Tax=Streptococcus hyointestinalis TaxID=1337 RepID=UPI0013DF0EAC|nr:DUF961 family protein [Streptococcus hyointestinalis]